MSKKHSVKTLKNLKISKDRDYACTYLKGKKIMLGRYGTPEAEEKFKQGFRQKIICQKYSNWSWLEFAKKLSFPSL